MRAFEEAGPPLPDPENMYYSRSRQSRTTPPLTPSTLEELGSGIQGSVHIRTDPNYLEYSKTFNGNVETYAKAIVCPLDAEDVRAVVLFCKKHSFSLSVKAGGYSTAGWAINGDIILEMSKLKGCAIAPPLEDGSYIGLRDTHLSKDTGKGKTAAPLEEDATSGKRRRQDDAELRTYSDASRAMDQFLHPRQNYDVEDLPSDNVRQRTTFKRDSRSESQSSDSDTNSGNTSGSSTNSNHSATSTAQTSPSPPAETDSQSTLPKRPSPMSTDPFAYMDGKSSNTPASFSTTYYPPAPPAGATQASFGAMHGAFNTSMYASWRPPNDPPSGSNGSTGMIAMSGSVLGGVGGSLMSMSPLAFGGSGPSGFNGETNFSMFDPTSPTAPLSLLAQAEPRYTHAYVTFGAAARTKEIDQYTQSHPLEATSVGGAAVKIPYHVPLTAFPVGSGAVLLGGFGFLSRLRGLSSDNLVEVEMVLADGRIVIVNEKENPELFFCVRGAGPAFGCITRMVMKAYPVPLCFAGNLVYNFHRSTAGSLIKHVRDCVKAAPNELYVNILLTAGPTGQGSLVVVQMCYLGSREQGQEYLDAISSWDGERCVLNEVTEKNFLAQQDSVAQVLRGKAGRQWFIRSALINSLPDDIVAKTVIEFSSIPYGCTWFFELAKGIIPSLEGTCIPKEQREASFTIAALHQWEMGDEDARCIDTAEHWIYKTLKPISIGGPFPGFLGRHEPVERTMASYGTNWDKLCELKRKYDPTNLFSNNFWPLEVDGKPIDPIAHEPLAPRGTVDKGSILPY